MNILYIENHPVFAANVEQQFLREHLVTLVPSLSAARQAMLNENFDVLLVDYDLDDGKGDELVQELRKFDNPTPIIGVSSHEEGNTALLKAGATAVCSKMNFDQIQKVIDAVAPEKKAK